jgi:hypothetical protein
MPGGGEVTLCKLRLMKADLRRAWPRKPGLRTQVKIAAAMAVILLAAGCSRGSPNSSSSSSSNNNPVLSNPVVRITLIATRDVLVFVRDNSGDPAISGIAELGVWGIDTIDPELASASAAAPDDTLLLVRQTIRGKVKVSLFRIDTGRELQATLNGKFVEYIAPHEIDIDVDPDTNSKIIVTDANANEHIYRSGSVQIGLLHKQIDLDTGSKTPAAGQGEIEAGEFGKVTAVNGTTVALWTQGLQPSLSGCQELPPQDWGSELSSVRLWHGIPVGTTWCVHTPENRYGVIIWEHSVLTDTFSYVLWK